jgi:hypothetical protein
VIGCQPRDDCAADSTGSAGHDRKRGGSCWLRWTSGGPPFAEANRAHPPTSKTSPQHRR